MTVALYVDATHDGHDPGPSHPERPERIDAVLAALDDDDLDVEYIEAPEAELLELRKVHDARYLEMLEHFCATGGGLLDQDTRVSAASFEVAKKAAGAAAAAVRRVMAPRPGPAGRAFCLVRPPGHHAGREEAMGFCLINNVAVGSRSAQQAGAKRVAIVDFDVHHGNGTQEIFYDDPSVLYLSMHQYPWYPGPSGSLNFMGSGAAVGSNVNLPLQAYGSDDLYLGCLQRLVAPIVEQFEPEILLVSAGFDAHKEDPLALMEVTSEGFAAMTEKLCDLSDRVCGGRLVFVLEGGYNLKAMAESVKGSISVLLGADPPAPRRTEPPSPSSAAEIDALVSFHSRRWNVT